MTVTSTLHNHCTLCDGKGTLAEMIQAALALGFTDFGMSCHGVTPFDPDYSLKDEAGYIAAIREARTRCADRLRVYLGVEQDFYAPVQDRGAFDYCIGSVHYLLDGDTGVYHSVDDTPEKLRACIDTVFGGDALAMVRRYYELVVENVLTFRPDVVGHFDLVTKFNADGSFFDESSPQYRRIALEALERAAGTGAVFEVNTGAMSRHWRAAPYPARFLLERMRELDIPVTLSADSHSPETLVYGFDEAIALLKRVGYDSVLVWLNGAFRPVRL